MTTKRRAGFNPVFAITPAMAGALMRIEAVRQAVQLLPVTPRVLANLRETARLFSTHYSTMIEGNRLTREQVAQVIAADRHFPGRERDEDEVKGYHAALDELERLAGRGDKITEAAVQRLHALVMCAGRTRVKPTPYRDGQNVIRDALNRRIVYMPPEASDVPSLMRELIDWINGNDELPVPIKAAVAHYQYATYFEQGLTPVCSTAIKAAVAHYQYATIHPYYDGNGRTARLLTTLILYLGAYDLKGIYALEEYPGSRRRRYHPVDRLFHRRHGGLFREGARPSPARSRKRR